MHRRRSSDDHVVPGPSPTPGPSTVARRSASRPRARRRGTTAGSSAMRATPRRLRACLCLTAAAVEQPRGARRRVLTRSRRRAAPDDSTDRSVRRLVSCAAGIDGFHGSAARRAAAPLRPEPPARRRPRPRRPPSTRPCAAANDRGYECLLVADACCVARSDELDRRCALDHRPCPAASSARSAPPDPCSALTACIAHPVPIARRPNMTTYGPVDARSLRLALRRRASTRPARRWSTSTGRPTSAAPAATSTPWATTST